MRNLFSKRFRFIQQLDSSDCGIACIRMIAGDYGRDFSSAYLQGLSVMSKVGFNGQQLSRIAEQVGFRTLMVKLTPDRIKKEMPLPAIAHWEGNHYVVLYKVTDTAYYVADPAKGLKKYTPEEFQASWCNAQGDGMLMLLEPTPSLKTHNARSAEQENKATFRFVLKYMFSYRTLFIQLMCGLFLGSLLQLLLPFLTRTVIDEGIIAGDINFIYLVVGAQFAVYLGSTVVEFIRSWILVHLSSRINVFIISDFLMKLMGLPMRFFDGRLRGDLIQRIRDHDRIERFLTDTLLKSLFSIFSVIVLCSVLAYYNPVIFAIFISLSVFEIGWIFFYLKKMRSNDNLIFGLMAKDQSTVMELINGMQEIKLNNIEQKKRWDWEQVQAQLFRANIEKLKLGQKQNGMARFVNHLQVVSINLLCAIFVVQGNITLGTMMAIMFVIGQLNVPVSQLINFVLHGHIAKISLERMSEIHNEKDEEETTARVKELPSGIDISITNMGFSFSGNPMENVLHDINLVIPQGKITAIVGASGSGKTTLIKLLLKFYKPTSGKIIVGGVALDEVSNAVWRDKCGAVLQDSFIFSDSIAGNIALTNEPDMERLRTAAKVANIQTFIESLPQQYDTRIGQDGMKLSQGQHQRVLIARAVYKQPEFLFFDEATNALDANNEKVIMHHMEQFFKNRTVVIAAHRLSTIRKADQIVLINQGRIVEYGQHEALLANRNMYFELVQSQL